MQALQVDVQAEPAGGADYQPLVDVQGLPCWPSQPDFAQLQGGAALQAAGVNFEADWDSTCARPLTLQVQQDFDFVVLGLGIAALPRVAAELMACEPRWRDMVGQVKTLPTQAFQVRLREDMDSLGWPHAPVNLSGFVEPFDTWADMRHLLPEERFAPPVRAIAYFCRMLQDTNPDTNPDANPDTTPDAAPDATPAAAPQSDLRAMHQPQRALVRSHAVNFLDRDIGALWPRALRPEGGFRWDLLVPADAQGPPDAAPADAIRFDSQYWTANVNASDHYVLSLPGSPARRLSPLDRSFDNLTIAGDWAASGLDTGCIESAVISGRLAAHAISQSPALKDIVGYDHPDERSNCHWRCHEPQRSRAGDTAPPAAPAATAPGATATPAAGPAGWPRAAGLCRARRGHRRPTRQGDCRTGVAAQRRGRGVAGARRQSRRTAGRLVDTGNRTRRSRPGSLALYSEPGQMQLRLTLADAPPPGRHEARLADSQGQDWGGVVVTLAPAGSGSIAAHAVAAAP